MSISRSQPPPYVATGTFLAAILLGACCCLFALLVCPVSSRVSSRAVGRWECGLATALLVVQGVATTLLIVFSEHLVDAEGASLFLFIVLCCALATRLLVKLYLIYYIWQKRFVRTFNERIAFTVLAASVALVGGSLSVNATYKRIILHRGSELGVQVESFAGAACTWLVLIASFIILYRCAKGKLVLSFVGLVVSLQTLVAATSFVDDDWVWLYRIPITNLFIIMYLLVLLAPRTRPSIPSTTSNNRNSTLKLSTLSKHSPPAQIEVEGLDDPSSRWSSDTNDRGRFQSAFKNMRGGTPVASLDGHGRESLSFGGSSEEGGGGWFMGRTGPLRRPPFSSVGNDSMLSFKVALEEGAPTSPDWTTAALSPEQPFQFGADFGRYPPPPPTGRLSPSQCYSPQPTSATDNLLPSSPPQTARRRSLSHPPLPAFPCPPPRVQSRRSATAPCVLPSQAGHLNQLTGGYHPFAMEASQGDGHAGARGAPNEFGIEEIGVARG